MKGIKEVFTGYPGDFSAEKQRDIVRDKGISLINALNRVGVLHVQ